MLGDNSARSSVEASRQPSPELHAGRGSRWSACRALKCSHTEVTSTSAKTHKIRISHFCFSAAHSFLSPWDDSCLLLETSRVSGGCQRRTCSKNHIFSSWATFQHLSLSGGAPAPIPFWPSLRVPQSKENAVRWSWKLKDQWTDLQESW